MLYLEGSILFTVGGSFSVFTPSFVMGNATVPLPPTGIVSVVDVPYFVGSVCFTLGAWAGVEEMLRLPAEMRGSRRPPVFCLAGVRIWRRLRKVVSWEPLIAYPAYFGGALLFNVSTIAAFFTRERRAVEEAGVWLPAVLGSIGFVVGGVCECHRNALGTRLCQRGAAVACDVVVWLCILNTAGALLFLLAALTGAAQVYAASGESGSQPAVLERWLVDFAYTLGSICFLGGSLCLLWLWKGGQFGLGLLPELNNEAARSDAFDSLRPHDEESEACQAAPSEQERRLASLAQYGCGKSSTSQLPWLFVYLVNACASVLDVAIAMQPTMLRPDVARDAQRIVESLLNFALSHGIVLLGSVVHHVPTAQPHGFLLRYMRAVLLVYTINSWANVFLLLRQLAHEQMCADVGGPHCPH